MENKHDIIQPFIKLGCKCSNNGYHLYDIQKWLREERNIHIMFDVDSNQGKWFFVLSNLKRLMVYDNVISDYFKTYEEALEAGIWEAYFILNN